MKPSAILAIDQGTTGTRAILFDHEARPLGSSYQEFRQYYPHPGWVEHHPQEIWNSTLSVVKKALGGAGISSEQIAAIGITNQRETTVLWDPKSGRPVCPAIVWQDRRTAHLTDRLREKGLEPLFRNRTGLVLDPYFSGSKIHWLLEHHPSLRRKAKQGRILFGTIDSWLLWNLTGGREHATDYTNASRTLVFNIKTRRWDDALCKVFEIPKDILPEARDSGSLFGRTVSQGALKRGIPITAILGDQQAALYGQGCYEKGSAKNTYGTGCFIVMNIGNSFKKPPFGLLSTLACDREGKPCYALEGAIFIGGAAVQWLRDGLGFFKHARETESLIKKIRDAGGVTVVPALTGLGSPYWNPQARGMITGLTRGTRREHIIRATLESMAHQTADVIDIMKKYSGHQLKELKVDGGATSNRFLMQFQADILNLPVAVSDLSESTAWGAAKLAARSIGFWPSSRKADRRRRYRIFKPDMRSRERDRLRALWKKEIQRLLVC